MPKRILTLLLLVGLYAPLTAQIDCYPFVGKAAFVRSTVGHPWDDFGVNTLANLNNLDDIFGVGQWSDLRYETVDINFLLDNHTFIYCEGGDDNAQEMENFLNIHLPVMEDWVAEGNRLLLNSAPNEGNGMSYGFQGGDGVGVQLVYNGGASLNFDAIPVDLNHPLYTGIVANYFDGNYMGHSVIQGGAGLVNILRAADNINEIMLCETDWGAGKVLFGGLTLPWYEMVNGWGPQTDLMEFGFNVLLYASQGDIDCPPDCAGVPGGDAYIDECGVCVEGDTGLEPCVLGCVDGAACNYDAGATVDDGSCEYIVDCAGLCGGNSEIDACGVCYDPDGPEQIVANFFFTGLFQSFTVPFGVDSIYVEAWGAQGGKSSSCNGVNDFQDDGGLGGYSRGHLLVVQGETYYIYVGGQGSINGPSGWNGGGGGGQYAGGGGGASDVRASIGVLASRRIVAGGGGGGQRGCTLDYGIGGNGGGSAGQAGVALITGVGGNGGGQVSGGAAGTAPSNSGTFGNGGNTLQSHVAGGGGGWYGGGSAYRAGGGGGSGYLGGVVLGATTAGQNAGNGSVRFTYRIEFPICLNDCNGDLNGTAYLDDCGICVEGLTGLLPCIPGCVDVAACNYDPDATDDDGTCAYIVDCNGLCGGIFVQDACGNCYDPNQGIPYCVLGCDGVLYEDPNLLPVVDCFGICGGNAVIDDCGICGGDNSSCTDCAGVINGNSIINDCGLCYDPTLIVPDSITFNFTGALQNFTVPNGVSLVTLKVWGAQGGDSQACNPNPIQTDGGLGGYSEANYNVIPGQILRVYVGGKGNSNGTAGWNGGGSGGQFGSGGGGATDIRTTVGVLASRLIVGGGGGAGNTGCPNAGAGGNGGGFNGTVGTSLIGNTGGGGGGQASGGSAGTAPSQAGSFGNGGGVFGQNIAGGGGGWYGGGAAFRAGGGGGSSYVGGGQLAVTIAGQRSGNGQARIIYTIEPECVLGCTNPIAFNFDPLANVDDGSCLYAGCTNPVAANYDPGATEDDGSCIIEGCTFDWAANYDPAATLDDGSCTCSVLGCTDLTAFNYNANATQDDGSCVPVVNGCTVALSTNYNAAANTDDGSCIPMVFGCTNPASFNYNAAANTNNGGCIPFQPGCTDPAGLNFNIYANTDDGSCILSVSGCTDGCALNFEPAATLDDGSCIFGNPCGENTYWDDALQQCVAIGTCPGDLNFDGFVNTADLLIFLTSFGLSCEQILGE